MKMKKLLLLIAGIAISTLLCFNAAEASKLSSTTAAMKIFKNSVKVKKSLYIKKMNVKKAIKKRMLKSVYDTNDNGKIDADKIASGLSASLISTGLINNTEFNYLNGLTSNIQTQLNAKGVGNMLKSVYDTNNDGKIDANKINSGVSAALIGAGSVDNTEFGYVNGVTSAVQTQIDSKLLPSFLQRSKDPV